MHVEYSSVLNFRGGGFSKEGVGSQHNFLEVRVGGGEVRIKRPSGQGIILLVKMGGWEGGN